MIYTFLIPSEYAKCRYWFTLVRLNDDYAYTRYIVTYLTFSIEKRSKRLYIYMCLLFHYLNYCVYQNIQTILVSALQL